MHIHRLSLAEGARNARGTAVIIDVFRAFTCEPLMYHYGAEQIILEADIDRCLAFKGDVLRVGERNELPIHGFDLTNSPSLIMAGGHDLFAGRRVIHRTTAGVTGALEAIGHADEVLMASFCNAGATAGYLRATGPSHVSLVAMGIQTKSSAPEDDRCGDYIEHLLTGTPYDHIAAVAEIISHETAQKFLRGDREYLPREDPAICLQRDMVDFALVARVVDGSVTAVPVRPAG